MGIAEQLFERHRHGETWAEIGVSLSQDAVRKMSDHHDKLENQHGYDADQEKYTRRVQTTMKQRETRMMTFRIYGAAIRRRN